MGLFRRRRDEEDPLAALRGDGTSAFGTPTVGVTSAVPVSTPLPAPSPDAGADGPARIIARRDTGVLVAGVPRARLTIALPGGGSFETTVLVAPGSAAEIGDPVDLVSEDGERGVRLRPAVRPAR